MAGTFTSKLVADGQLSAAANTVLYTVPAVTTDILKTITICNTSGAAVTINIYVKKSAGTARRIFDKDYSMPAGEARQISLNVVIEASGELQGDASTGAVVDYTVSAIRET